MLPDYPLHYVTFAPAMFEVATPNSFGGDAFTRNTLFGLRVKVTQNVAQCTLHHVTYAPAKFEDATSNCLGSAVAQW